MEKIIQNIKSIRGQLGVSQEYIAEQLGITQSAYAYIEQGQRRLAYDTVEKIAATFNMSVVDLITYPEKWVNSAEIAASQKKVSVTFEIDASQRDYLLRLVAGTIEPTK